MTKKELILKIYQTFWTTERELFISQLELLYKTSKMLDCFKDELEYFLEKISNAIVIVDEEYDDCGCCFFGYVYEKIAIPRHYNKYEKFEKQMMKKSKDDLEYFLREIRIKGDE